LAIYSDGTNGNILAAADLTFDVAGDIVLDAAGNDIIFKDAGTTFGQITNDSTNMIIYNAGSQMLKGLSSGSDAQFMGKLTVGSGSYTNSQYYAKDVVINAANEGGMTIASSANTHAAYIMFADGVSSGSEQYAGYIEYNHSADRFRVKSNGTFQVYATTFGADALTVLSDGKVGIDTSPSFTFHVSSSDVNAGVFDSDSDSGTYLWVRNSDATTGRTVNLGFAPANNIEGARISAEAMEDFSSSANRTADLAFQTRKDGTMSEKMRLESHGTASLFGEGGSYGFSIPYDQNMGYTNNLNAGGFSILHRNDRDCYIVGNAYYYKTGGAASWRAKFGLYKSNIISMVDGRINFQASDTAVSANSVVTGLATRASIDQDGLKFGTDTAAANALDDYEEGQLTLGNVAGYLNVTGTPSQTYAEYTKIGSLIHIQASISVTPTSTGRTGISFTVPFVMHSASNVGLLGVVTAYPYNTDNGTGPILNFTGANNTQVYVETSVTSTTTTNFTFQMTYRT